MIDTVTLQLGFLTHPFMKKYSQWIGPIRDIQNQTMFSEVFAPLDNGISLIHQEAGEHD